MTAVALFTKIAAKRSTRSRSACRAESGTEVRTPLRFPPLRSSTPIRVALSPCRVTWPWNFVPLPPWRLRSGRLTQFQGTRVSWNASSCLLVPNSTWPPPPTKPWWHISIAAGAMGTGTTGREDGCSTGGMVSGVLSARQLEAGPQPQSTARLAQTDMTPPCATKMKIAICR